MDLYGIKVKYNICSIRKKCLNSMCVCIGEANANFNTDKYNCTFAKMIQSWRETWNTRTNNNTDIEFPFGFVQVSFVVHD